MSYKDCMKCEEIKCAFKLLAKKEGCADPTKAKPKKKGKDGCTVNVTVNCGPGGSDGPPGSSINPQGVNTQHGAPGAGTKYLPPATNFPQLKPLPPPKPQEVIDLTNYRMPPGDEEKLNQKEENFKVKEENKQLDARQKLSDGDSSLLQTGIQTGRRWVRNVADATRDVAAGLVRNVADATRDVAAGHADLYSNNFVGPNSYPGLNFSNAPDEVRDDLRAAQADMKPKPPTHHTPHTVAESKPTGETPSMSGFHTPYSPYGGVDASDLSSRLATVQKAYQKNAATQSVAQQADAATQFDSAEEKLNNSTIKLEEKANELRKDKENEQLKQTVSNLTNEVENHRRDLQELAQQKRQADSAAAESNQRANVLQGERDSISEREKEVRRALEDQADEYANERDLYELHLQQASQAFNDLNTEKTKLLDDNRKMADELVSVRALHIEAQYDVADKTRQLQEAIHNLEKLKRDPDRNFDKNRMTEDMLHLSNTIRELRYEKSVLEERMGTLGKNYSILQEAKEKADIVNNTKMAEVIAREENLKKDNQDLIEAAEIQNQREMKYEEAKNKANERADQIEAWYEEAKTEVEAATAQIEKLENQVTELNDSIKELEKTKPTVSSNRKEKEKMMANLKGVVNKTNKKLAQTKTEKNKLERALQKAQRQAKEPEESVDPHEKALDNPSVRVTTGDELHNIYADNQDKIETIEDDENKVAKEISRIEKRTNNVDRIQKLPDKSGTNSQENKIGKTAEQQDVSTIRRRTKDINEKNRQARNQYAQEIQEAYEGNEDELNATAARFLNILTNQRDKDYEIKANDFLRNYTNFDADVVKSAIKKNITDNINPKWSKKNNSDGTFRYEVTGRSIKTKC